MRSETVGEKLSNIVRMCWLHPSKTEGDKDTYLMACHAPHLGRSLLAWAGHINTGDHAWRTALKTQWLLSYATISVEISKMIEVPG